MIYGISITEIRDLKGFVSFPGIKLILKCFNEILFISGKTPKGLRIFSNRDKILFFIYSINRIFKA